MNLTNKTIIITGASEGLGKHVAVRLAKHHPKLALIGRNLEKLYQVDAEVLNNGAYDSKTYVCDVSDLQQVKKTVAAITTDLGTPSVLVNNAGVWQKRGQLETVTDDMIDQVIDINLRGLIQMTKQVLPQLRTQPEAAIINISSRSGVTAQPGQSVYSATKWGVTGFSEVLRQDLLGTPVRVATVHQAGTQTNLFLNAQEDVPSDKFQTFTPVDGLAEVIEFMLTRPDHVWIHDIRIEG